MLTYAVLVLAVITPTKIKIDHEYYEDIYECKSTADFINDYNKDNVPEFRVMSACIQLDPNEVVKEV